MFDGKLELTEYCVLWNVYTTNKHKRLHIRREVSFNFELNEKPNGTKPETHNETNKRKN